MRRRIILLYALLVILPALITGGLLFRLLDHERDRIARQANDAVTTRIETFGAALRSTVATVQDGITAELAELETDDLGATLQEWQDTNPLIRNVFIWNSSTGLTWPEPGSPATKEETRFVTQFAALFSGERPWSVPEESLRPGQPSPQMQLDGQQSYEQAATPEQFVQDVRQMAANSIDMSRLLRSRQVPAVEPGQSGWIPWFTGESLALLGWVRRPGSDVVYGVELEFVAMLSRLTTALPTHPPAGRACAILDGAGNIMHLVGEDIDTDKAQSISASLAPQLPHWNVVVYFPDGLPGTALRRSFAVLASVLTGTFMIAIVLGGGLLARAAQQSHLDATRKTTFVSNVSHELKTPLTSIRMYAELLSEGRARDETKRAHYLHIIVSEAERLTRLVNNVLDFSRLEQKRKKYHPENIEIGPFVKDLLDSVALQTKQAGLTVETVAPAPSPCAFVDRDALGQALRNLIDNTAKYAAEGGELLVRISSGQGDVSIDICDRGPGIPTAHRRRVFDKFHRIDGSLTATQPGSGLGLSIARSLMQDQGGSLEFTPRPDGGSCFTIRLPAASGGYTGEQDA